MRLSDPFNLRTWKYTGVTAEGHRGQPMLINENLTGAVVGDHQKPARIPFRTAMWIVYGWSQLGHMQYRLVIPNPGT